jgi:hypothetical protein
MINRVRVTGTRSQACRDLLASWTVGRLIFLRKEQANQNADCSPMLLVSLLMPVTSSTPGGEPKRINQTSNSSKRTSKPKCGLFTDVVSLLMPVTSSTPGGEPKRINQTSNSPSHKTNNRWQEEDEEHRLQKCACESCQRQDTVAPCSDKRTTSTSK